MAKISEVAMQCFDSLNVGIVVTRYDEDAPIIYCNDAFCSLTGYTRAEILEQNCRFLQGPETSEGVRNSIKLAIKNQTPYRVVIKNYKKDGAAFWNDLYLNPIRDDQGKVTHYLGLQNDISQFGRNNRSAPFHIPYDDLTQLPTPAMAIELMKMNPAYEQTPHNSAFLGAIIVNGLANLRGFIGDGAVDIAILEVCDRFKELLDDNYIFARAGEREFIVASLTTPQAQAREKLEQLCNSILQPVQIEGRRFQLTFNAGFIGNLPHALTEQGARLCNFALAKSLDQGRNRIVEFDNEDLQQTEADQILAASVLGGLNAGEFYPAYQPQVNLKDNSIVGFEALARWEHPVLGGISPGRFIPIYEQSGYIDLLTLNLLVQVCRDLPAITAKYGDVNVSVNFSPLSLLDTEFVNKFIFTAHALCPQRGRISIEVVENLSIDGYEAAAKNLEALREAGFAVILDDFGTGYSSLSYIKNLGASVVKIDREFVMNLNGCNNDDLAIIKAVVSLSKQFDFEVIAEGIEEAEQAAIVLGEGVGIGQGYFFARPQRIEHFI